MTENSNGQSTGTQYPFYIHDQYVKDLSFESPNYLMKYTESDMQPEISVNIETNVGKLSEDNYEVQMVMSVRSKSKTVDLFVLELTYAALVSVASDLTSDVLEPVLLVHCPFLMFPFARSVIMSVIASGGYPPLLVEPLDFAALYLEKKKSQQAPTVN